MNRPLNRTLRLAIAAMLAGSAWLAQAQSSKCVLAAASRAHPSAPCSPSDRSAGVSTGSSDGLFHFSRVREQLTPACREGTDHVIGACATEGEDDKRRCWRTRLTATCQEQTTQLRAKRDAACEQQISSCERESTREFPGCVQRRLPADCMEQIRAANRANEHR
jgi:hypothetical protein